MNVADVPEGTLLLEPRDQFDSCLVGVCHQAGNYVALYSRTKVIEALMADMSYEDAVEHYDFNVSGTIGWGYPYFLLDDDDEEDIERQARWRSRVRAALRNALR